MLKWCEDAVGCALFLELAVVFKAIEELAATHHKLNIIRNSIKAVFVGFTAVSTVEWPLTTEW